MKDDRDKRFYVSSVGNLFLKSLEMFADRIVSAQGQVVDPKKMELNESATVEFQGPTRTTRTSVVRIE
ncbi:hypothetical protein [Desulfogranum marinum]|uniref:hypothetical protein n=1 Tax=Desulfogranum marinum TaxID=453220 RepID=UPI00196265BC|nr:hypothetical protein [Desulfogranum marinum]MBM9512230.1 hypothetical protein [Desulfogranum marinum]